MGQLKGYNRIAEGLRIKANPSLDMSTAFKGIDLLEIVHTTQLDCPEIALMTAIDETLV